MQSAANYQNVDVSLLASIAIRETGANNVPQIGGGGGHGVVQLDSGTWGQVGWAYNTQYGAVVAGGVLSADIQYYAGQGYNSHAALAGGIRAYNAGFGRTPGIRQFVANRLNTVQQTGLSAFADKGTARNNYVSNVLDILRDCFN